MPTAIVPAPALGDGLLALVLAHHLRRSDQPVYVVHDALGKLRTWLPWARVVPRTDLDEVLRSSVRAFVGDPAAFAHAALPPDTLRFRKADWQRDAPYPVSLERACAAWLGSTPWLNSPGLVRPDVPAVDAARIVLHPTSGNPRKNWPPKHWRALGERLAGEGARTTVLLAASEVAAWRAEAGDALPIAVPGGLDAVASFLADSAGCIATDSGIAHLAAAVGCPTLTLFRKASAARFWAPTWGRTAAVMAPWRLPGGAGHRLWRHLLSPARVHAAYRALRG
ncbi:MAG: hypothetical protein O2894_01350 [Planctomycetota bacterium]|nr:hypothetical protein [Planctomycetota bacterium]